MNHDHDIEQKLDALAHSISNGRSIKQAVMNSVRTIPMENRKGWFYMNTQKLRPAWSAPILILAVIIGWHVLFNNSSSVFVNAQEAIVNAKSLHIYREFKHKDGSLRARQEIWYHRDYGVIKSEPGKNDSRVIMLDNNEYQWRYTVGDKTVHKKKSEGCLVEIENLLSLSAFREKFSEKPDHSKTIDGEILQVYLSIPTENDYFRDKAFLDHKNRIRIIDTYRNMDAGKWEHFAHTVIEYDIPIEPSLFEPGFNSESVIKEDVVEIDTDNLFEEYFGLEKALYKYKEWGIVFAIHDIKRLDNGLIYILHSNRPGEELLQELGLLHSFDPEPGNNILNYCAHKLGWDIKRSDNRENQYSGEKEIAFFSHNGLVANWTIFYSNLPANIDEIDLRLTMIAAGKLGKKFESQGKEVTLDINPLTTLPLPQETVSLDGLLDDLYNDASKLEPAVFTIVFWDTPGKKQVLQKHELSQQMPNFIKPSNIFLDKFKENFIKQLEQQRREAKPQER
jgi:hypothetical protein